MSHKDHEDHERDEDHEHEHEHEHPEREAQPSRWPALEPADRQRLAEARALTDRLTPARALPWQRSRCD